MNSLYVLAIYD